MKTNAIVIAFTLVAVLLLVGNVSAAVLVESPHPTAAFYTNTWHITNPSATQIRVHFTKIDLAQDPNQFQSGDTLVLKDQNGKIVHTYKGGK